MPALSSRRKQQLRDLLLANLTLVATLLASFAGATLLYSFTANVLVLSTIPLLAATIGVTAVAVAVHPDVKCDSLGLGRRPIAGTLWGLLLGAAACALAVVISITLHWAEWTAVDPSLLRFDWRETPLAGLALLVTGAMGEELFMRGLLLQFLARSLGPFAAVAATSIAFSLLHYGNPGFTDVALVNTALFGVLFGLAVVRGRSLWLAFGLHLGWNAAQVVLGVNTSGITIRLTDLNFESRGAEWLAGGDYGLEGGVLATCMAILLAGIVWARPWWRGPQRMFWEAPGTGAPQKAGSLGTLFGDLPGRGGHSGGAREDGKADGGTAHRTDSEPER